MKKFVSLVLLVAMLFSMTATQDSMNLVMKSANAESPAEENDFKDFPWGASLKEIIAVEGQPIGWPTISDENLILYETTVVGLDAQLGYFFSDGSLNQAAYIFSQSHSIDSLYIEDYETIKNALEEKYGEALIDLESWKDDSMKGYLSDRKGYALKNGYLQYVTCWTLDKTSILMIMSATDNEITTMVSFESN